MSHLDDAAAAIRRGDHGAALRALLTVWREAPSAALSALIVDLGAVADTLAMPLAGGTRAARQASWLERIATHDPVELGPLLDQLDELDRRQTIARLETLLEVPRDPRITVALRAYLGKELRLANQPRTWRLCGRLLERQADPAWLTLRRGLELYIGESALSRRVSGEQPPLEPELIHPTARRQFVVALRALEARLRSEPAHVHDLAAVRAALARRSLAPIEQLWDQVYADVRDLGARQVLADALIERGDERGELIALQVAAERTPPNAAQRKRIKALAQRYAHDLLGPIAEGLVKASIQLRAGLLDAAQVKRYRAQDFSRREWRSVRALSGRLWRATVIDPAFEWPLLQRLELVEREHVDALLAADPPPPSLVALTLPGGAIDIERFSTTALFEQLRELELVGGYTRRQHGLIHRLERLTWVSADDDLWRLIRTPAELELRLRRRRRWWSHEIEALERVLRDVPWRQIERVRLIDRGSPYAERIAETLGRLAGERLQP